MERIVFCILAIFFAGISAKTCSEHLQELESNPPVLGAFKPKCQADGSYETTQCHEYYCFCVFPKTGEKILGTEVRGRKPTSCVATECLLKRHQVIKKRLIGAFQPQCEEDGSFKKIQCHASTGYCFCVFPETGMKIVGTEIRFQHPKSCELTPCVQQRHDVLSVSPPLMGAFVPQCKPDGSFKEIQCQEGFCYCVFPETGKEIMGTRLNVRGEIPESCKQTDCVMQRHKLLSAPRPLLGAFKPQCNKDGSFNPIQYKAGFYFCVFPDGREVLGTISNERGVKPVSCKLTPCVLSRHKGWSIQKLGLLGVSVSRCDPDGKYSKVQCWKGMCWCVNQDTGKSIDGTNTYQGTPNC